MKETIMLLSSILFAVLFFFLVFIFIIFIASRFFKRDYKKFDPKITVVVPAYNEEKSIGECINSILNSNYSKDKLEIIFIDDGSKDNTLKIIKKFKGIKVLQQNHLGKVEAMNYGVLNSSHDFVLTIDADTILHKNCIKELIKPFSNQEIGATTGNNVVKNDQSMITTFQNIEYHFSNLIRNSFSKVFNNGIWFSGSLACYRRKTLEKINYFKKDTMAEDQDVALEMRKAGYKAVNVESAFGYTIVPSKIKDLYKQRARWWIGTLQAIVKNKSLFSRKSSGAILFLYINQFWWSFYAFLSLPLIIYQINYWLPYNSQDMSSMFTYFFRWFSLLGPVYVIYKIPEWGISIYSIFGVLSGIMTTVLSIAALRIFRDRINFRNLFAIFFYFPYTIVLNIIILVSLLRHRFWAKSFYIK